MESRHDVTHPLSMISMIASLITTYPDKLDHARLEALKDQMGLELEGLKGALDRQAFSMDTSHLATLVDGFMPGAGMYESASALESESLRLIELFKQAEVT